HAGGEADVTVLPRDHARVGAVDEDDLVAEAPESQQVLEDRPAVAAAARTLRQRAGDRDGGHVAGTAYPSSARMPPNASSQAAFKPSSRSVCQRPIELVALSVVRCSRNSAALSTRAIMSSMMVSLLSSPR